MGQKAVGKFLYLTSIVLTIISMVVNLIALYAGETNPVYSNTSTLLAYGLSVLVIINAIFLVYWLIRVRVWLLLPLIALICSIHYIGTIYRFGSPDKDAIGGIGIATYNVHGFNKDNSGAVSDDIKDYLIKKNIDVVCFQEYANFTLPTKERISDRFKEDYPYMVRGRSNMVIFSRYPIRESKTIDFENTNNSAMYADIDVNGRIYRVFNVHMQTTGINRSLRNAEKKRAAGKEVTDKEVFTSTATNLFAQARLRAEQAITVSNEVRLADKPVILCGDFNDIPYSYTYHTLKATLKDGFVTCGKGYMHTYRGAKSLMRIDYIFHAPELEGITYFTDDLPYSDHNPVIMRILTDKDNVSPR